MADTRGAATIVDRVEGWGHTASTDANREDNATWGDADGNTITATDATPETSDARFAKQRVGRKSGTPGDTPDTDDRVKGLGGDFDNTAGADDGYRTDGVATVWDDEDAEIGVDYDVEYAGTNTALANTHSETGATLRTADSRDTVLLNDDDAASRAESARTSIRDRSSGWGHTSGSFTYRND